MTDEGARLRGREELHTTDQSVRDCMGSAPECAANGCQFGKTAGYRQGEGPVFQERAGDLAYRGREEREK